MTEYQTDTTSAAEFLVTYLEDGLAEDFGAALDTGMSNEPENNLIIDWLEEHKTNARIAEGGKKFKPELREFLLNGLDKLFAEAKERFTI